MINIKKRIFLIVLDSVGIGAMPDAHLYGDESSNTLKAVSQSKMFRVPNMQKLGLFNIDGVDCGDKMKNPVGIFSRMSEISVGKDTTVGHWEIAGVISEKTFPTYPNGFPDEVIKQFEDKTQRKVLCNKPYSGTEVIKDYGKKHVETGNLIVYTSADSVFQIAAHEDIVPVDELYRYCQIARDILVGEHSVARVIARPFTGEYPNFQRTSNRHDFSLQPPEITMLDQLIENQKQVIAIGKIENIFSGRGISEYIATKNNADGIDQILKTMDRDFEGLCFANLVDFDMVYGHRNDVEGYAKALTEFDLGLDSMMSKMKDQDILMITADHGCDPSTASTDHSREYTPLLIYGPQVKCGVNLGTRSTFSDIAATILDYFSIKKQTQGNSFYNEIKITKEI